jgi:hypothetical protein
VVTPGRSLVQALKARGQQRPPVDYDNDIEMSDRVENNDDDVEDPALNYEISFR